MTGSETLRALSWRDAVGSSLLKVRTSSAVARVLLGVLVLTAILALLGDGDTVQVSVGDRLVPVSKVPAVATAPLYLFLVAPAWAAGSEYRSGQHQTTLLATPDRVRLVIGQVVALLAGTLASAVVVVLPGVVLAAATGENPVLAALVLARWLVVCTGMGGIAYGLATLTRSTTAPVTVLVLAPLAVASVPGLPEWLTRALPDELMRQILGLSATPHPLPAPVATVGLLLWGAVALGLHAMTVLRRDA